LSTAGTMEEAVVTVVVQYTPGGRADKGGEGGREVERGGLWDCMRMCWRCWRGDCIEGTCCCCCITGVDQLCVGAS